MVNIQSLTAEIRRGKKRKKKKKQDENIYGLPYYINETLTQSINQHVGTPFGQTSLADV